MSEEEEASFVRGSVVTHPITCLSDEIYRQYVLYFIGSETCFWEAYQANQSYEKCCHWLKHRAYEMWLGSCRRRWVEVA